MKILFLDQSGQLGGAELALQDLVAPYGQDALVGLFQAGPFYEQLQRRQIPAQVLLHNTLEMRKNGGLWQGLKNFDRLLPLICSVAQLSRAYDLIYANTPKSLIVGAIAAQISRRPFVYHLHDIISPAHFSKINRQLIIQIVNQCANLVIANSQASKQAFIQAGGKAQLVEVIYNGFEPENYQIPNEIVQQTRQTLGLSTPFIVGHFSRLSPWKGQHILLEALARCAPEIGAILVGDALFGETEYAAHLHRRVVELGLESRVKFLGFRSDIPALMSACDLVAHTSTAPEPFGRVIVEAMLCQTPVVATAAGGAIELIQHNLTGWLTEPGDATELADIVGSAYHAPDLITTITQQAYQNAMQQFLLTRIWQQTDQALTRLVAVA
jgi:glycosyltransferase involved in cell wall biosynthesis